MTGQPVQPMRGRLALPESFRTFRRETGREPPEGAVAMFAEIVPATYVDPRRPTKRLWWCQDEAGTFWPLHHIGKQDTKRGTGDKPKRTGKRRPAF